MCVSIYYSKHLPIRNCGGKKRFWYENKIRAQLYSSRILLLWDETIWIVSTHIFTSFLFPWWTSGHRPRKASESLGLREPALQVISGMWGRSGANWKQYLRNRSRKDGGPLSGAQRQKDEMVEGLSSSMLAECRLSQENEERFPLQPLTSIPLLSPQHCPWQAVQNPWEGEACLGKQLVSIEQKPRKRRTNPWGKGHKVRLHEAPGG